LGESELGISTFLSGSNLGNATGPGLCDDDPANYGLTPAQWALAQQTAYTYEVRIFDITLTAVQRALLDATLSKAEPARSTHVITDGLPDSLRVYV